MKSRFLSLFLLAPSSLFCLSRSLISLAVPLCLCLSLSYSTSLFFSLSLFSLSLALSLPLVLIVRRGKHLRSVSVACSDQRLLKAIKSQSMLRSGHLPSPRSIEALISAICLASSPRANRYRIRSQSFPAPCAIRRQRRHWPSAFCFFKGCPIGSK